MTEVSVSTAALSYEARRPVWERYDLVVCGGSGIPAALSARRAGLSVLLVEAQGQLGGVTTSAGVSHLLGGRTPDNQHQLVGGIFQEITAELARRGGAIDPRTIDWSGKYQPHGWNKGSLGAGVPVDPHLYAALLEEKMLDVERDVLGPLREQAPCYAMGHAAGLAAAQLIQENLAFQNVDADALREALMAGGAIVDFALAETLAGDTPVALRPGRQARRRGGVLGQIAEVEGIGVRKKA